MTNEIFSYRFGFVTFETEEEAQYVLQKVSNRYNCYVRCQSVMLLLCPCTNNFMCNDCCRIFLFTEYTDIFNDICDSAVCQYHIDTIWVCSCFVLLLVWRVAILHLSVSCYRCLLISHYRKIIRIDRFVCWRSTLHAPSRNAQHGDLLCVLSWNAGHNKIQPGTIKYNRTLVHNFRKSHSASMQNNFCLHPCM